MKHSYLMTTAVLAIAIPLVLGATGIINPSVAYAQEKRIQVNFANATNTATQDNVCGNGSIVAGLAAVVCANEATQSNTISQSQSYTEGGSSGSTATSSVEPPPNGGAEEVNVQLNAASASNSATQSNDCGNGSAVFLAAAVACVNSASQSNSINQTQSITDEG
jgi:hypothetical protein